MKFIGFPLRLLKDPQRKREETNRLSKLGRREQITTTSNQFWERPPQSRQRSTSAMELSKDQTNSLLPIKWSQLSSMRGASSGSIRGTRKWKLRDTNGGMRSSENAYSDPSCNLWPLRRMLPILIAHCPQPRAAEATERSTKTRSTTRARCSRNAKFTSSGCRVAAVHSAVPPLVRGLIARQLCGPKHTAQKVNLPSLRKEKARF